MSPLALARRIAGYSARPWQQHSIVAGSCALAAALSAIFFPPLLWMPLVSFLLAVTVSALYAGFNSALQSMVIGVSSIALLFPLRAQTWTVSWILWRELGFIVAALIVTGLAIDIRRAGQAFAQAEATRARAEVLESISDGFIAVDREWRFTYLNSRAVEDLSALGLSGTRESLVGTRLWDVLPAALRSDFEARLRAAVEAAHGTDLEFDSLTSDSSYLLSVYPSPAGAALYWHDITQRKLVEDRLRFFSSAAQELSGSLEPEAVLTAAARLAVPMLGSACVIDVLSAGGLLNRHVELLNAEGAVHLSLEPALVERTREIDAVLNTGTPRLYSTGLPPNGWPDELRERAACSILAPLVAGGRSLGLLTLIRTDLQRCYQEADMDMAQNFARRVALALENAELYSAVQAAVEVRDSFLRSVSHDLRGPLAAIKLRASILQRRIERGQLDSERFSEGLSDINGSVARMLRMVDELLDVARLAAGGLPELRLEQADLLAIVRDAVAEQQQMTDAHRLVLNTTEASIEGFWDTSRMRRVLDNLLSNATKYSPRGGDVVVGVRRDKPGWVEICVQDEGIGIPAGDLAELFEPFRRGTNVQRSEGTGIGLTSVRLTVQQHGGTVDVQSREGKGSAFTIRLPVVAPEQASTNLADSPGAG